jgi:hypothetical protein
LRIIDRPAPTRAVVVLRTELVATFVEQLERRVGELGLRRLSLAAHAEVVVLAEGLGLLFALLLIDELAVPNPKGLVLHRRMVNSFTP